MPVLDVFNQDAFNTVSLTSSINEMPYVPNRLGQLGLFTTKNIATTTAVVEKREGKLILLTTQPRGTMPNYDKSDVRSVRSFMVPHIPHNDTVMAADVQNVRQFGSENQLQSIIQVVNDRLESLRQDHESTHEWHRIGAIKGVVYEPDGTTEVYNWFTEFGITASTITITIATDSIKTKASQVIRHIQDSLGNIPYTSIHAMCGSDAFDLLVNSDEMKAAYDRWQESMFLRDSQVRQAFPYAGVMWEEYRGWANSTPFIAADQVHFFPVGARGVFERVNAPADMVEAVNTIAKPIYAKQERLDYDKGIGIHTQSNALFMCTMPNVLVSATVAAA